MEHNYHGQVFKMELESKMKQARMENKSDKKQSRGKKILGILKLLSDKALATAEVLDNIPSDYALSYAKARDALRGTDYVERRLAMEKKLRAEQQKLYNLIHHLKRQRLISKRGSKWEINPRGKDKIAKLEERIFMADRKRYPTEKTEDKVIVIFDIPEVQRNKRDWLRSVLFGMGFRPLQQSVWMGSAKLPKQFFKDLQFLKILSYVEVFVVRKIGTIGSDR